MGESWEDPGRYSGAGCRTDTRGEDGSCSWTETGSCQRRRLEGWLDKRWDMSARCVLLSCTFCSWVFKFLCFIINLLIRRILVKLFLCGSIKALNSLSEDNSLKRNTLVKIKYFYWLKLQFLLIWPATEFHLLSMQVLIISWLND